MHFEFSNAVTSQLRNYQKSKIDLHKYCIKHIKTNSIAQVLIYYPLTTLFFCTHKYINILQGSLSNSCFIF